MQRLSETVGAHHIHINNTSVYVECRIVVAGHMRLLQPTTSTHKRILAICAVQNWKHYDRSIFRVSFTLGGLVLLGCEMQMFAARTGGVFCMKSLYIHIYWGGWFSPYYTRACLAMCTNALTII